MGENHKKIKRKYFWLLLLFLFLLITTLGVGSYFYLQTKKSFDLTKIELLNTKSDLVQLEERAKSLAQNLEAEQYKNTLFEGQINEIVGTVGNLDKLSKTDKELLQKYSKIYFLNEHYIPDGLSLIPEEFLYEKDRKIEIHRNILPPLSSLLNDAKKGGIDIKIISGFRSFGQQSVLKNEYKIMYGVGANKFSADQGYSEHQLGTALDFTTSKTGSDFNKFQSTDTYRWLLENAHKYGFILSYPENNSYYQFEPWHWRFVGKNLALMLYEEKKFFYDLPQNRIDSYLINIFD